MNYPVRDQPQNEMQLTQLIENVLATVTYATRGSVSRALNMSPGNLVFNRDMFVDVPLISNLAAIRDRRQQLIDENLIRENKKRREFRYQAGQEVLLKSVDPRKMDPKAHGPYTSHPTSVPKRDYRRGAESSCFRTDKHSTSNSISKKLDGGSD